MPDGGMKLLKPAFYATFCGMEKQTCDLLVTASRLITGTEQPGVDSKAGWPSGTGRFWKRDLRKAGGGLDACRPARFGEMPC